MTNEITSKRIFDGGTVRMTTTRYTILVEELPRKPCKVVLRSTEFHMYSAIYHSHCDAYLPENLLLDIASTLDETDGYDTLVTMLRGAIQLADKAYPAAKHGVSISKDERHYTKVTPEGVAPIEIALKNTTISASWTKFEVYSPGSTMSYPGDGQPHYSMVESSSEAMARKLYKLAQDPKVLAELAEQTWSTLTTWLAAKKITVKHHHSQWT